MIGDNAVNLLRHVTIPASQAGLDVGKGNLQLAGAQRAGERGISIAVNNHPVWLLLQQNGLKLGENLSGLLAVWLRANAEMILGLRQAKFLEKHRRHFVIIMLAGVNQDFTQITLFGYFMRNDGSFDKLRARANDGDEATH
ncbi:MAG: hypothetical protein ALAOOOJD_01212 [bacterium]|nr:hypothetical protein [bacterium]